MKHSVTLFAALICLASSPVSAGACDRLHDLQMYAASVDGQVAAKCNSYLAQDGGSGDACYWEFEFRSEDATEFAEEIWSEIRSCEGNASGPDALVNHPDSYDLRAWINEGRAYWVSIKDKGALNRTLVFVRSEERH